MLKRWTHWECSFIDEEFFCKASEVDDLESSLDEANGYAQMHCDMRTALEAELEATKALLQVRTEALAQVSLIEADSTSSAGDKIRAAARVARQALALKTSEAVKQTPKGEGENI